MFAQEFSPLNNLSACTSAQLFQMLQAANVFREFYSRFGAGSDESALPPWFYIVQQEIAKRTKQQNVDLASFETWTFNDLATFYAKLRTDLIRNQEPGSENWQETLQTIEALRRELRSRKSANLQSSLAATLAHATSV
jgi:hypothetical protein